MKWDESDESDDGKKDIKKDDDGSNEDDEKDKNVPIVQVIKKVINVKDKYEGYQDDVASWEKYGYKDYALEYEE